MTRTAVLVLVLVLALGASLALGAPVPSSTSTDPVPSATPTPWRYPDTDDSGICAGQTKPTCTKRRLALGLGCFFGFLLLTAPVLVNDGGYTRAWVWVKALPGKMAAGAAQLAAGVLACPGKVATGIVNAAICVWDATKHAAHAAARLAPSRRRPPVPPKESVEVLLDDDAKSVASAESSLAPTYVSDYAAPPYSPAVPPV